MKESTNPATKTMDKVTDMLVNIDKKLKDMGHDKYGMVEATPTEKAKIKQAVIESMEE